MDGPRYDVFLSHTSSDKPVVEELAHLLRERGIEPWLDVWHLVPGAAWQEAIEKALRSCATVAVCLGPSGTGPWQNEEMRAAINRRVTDKEGTFRVIPILLPGTERGEPSRYPDFLTATTWVEFRDTLDDKRALHRLVCGIRGTEPDPELENLVVVEGVSPYRGLQSFDVEDARFFFGREAQTEWLLDKLRPASAENRFLAILGPSGSGKSSLARAGLLALLKKGEKIPGSQDWPVAISKPGVQPLESLAVALTSAVRSGDSSSLLGLIGDLEKDSRTLHLTTRLTLHDAPAERRFVILVDQFEEIFTLCSDEARRKALIDNLLHAATAAEGRTVVLLTLRADFYGRCAAYPTLAAAVSDRQILVGPMSPEELRRAIERPALLAGCELEPGLADLLMEEVEGQPGSLPLLQHALLQIWDRRKGRRLTVEACREIGGVDGALEKHAEEIYSGFGDVEREMCQRVFLGLVQPAEGEVFTRRRLLLVDLLPAAGGETFGRELHSVVGKLADARLLTTSDQKNPSIELAHEALIKGWSRFRGWIEHDREALLVRRHLDETAAEWAANERDPSYLYRGSLLARAEEWDEENPGELNLSERKFLDVSLALRDEERRRELAQVQALEAEQRRRADAEGRRKTLARRAAIVFAFLALVAVVFAIQSWLQKREAERRRLVNLAAVLAGKVESALAANPQTGLLLAVEAMNLARQGREPHLPVAEEALRQALFASGGRPLGDARIAAATTTSDNRWLVTASLDGKVHLWDLSSEDPVASRRFLLHLDEKGMNGLELSNNRRWLLTRDAEGLIRRRDLTAKDGQAEAVEEDWWSGSHPFSPDSRWVITRDYGTPVLRELKTRSIRRPSKSFDALAVAYSPDNRWLALASEESVQLWDLRRQNPTSSPLEPLEGKGMFESLAFSSDGRSLAGLVKQTGDVRLWRVNAEGAVGAPLHIEGCPESHRVALVSNRLLTWGNGDQLCIANVQDGSRMRLSAPKGGVRASAASPDGRWLALGSDEGALVLYGPSRNPLRLPGHAGPIQLLAFSPDGRWLVSQSGNLVDRGEPDDQGDEAPRLWDLRRGEALADLEPTVHRHPALPRSLAMTPDGSRLVGIGADEKPFLWTARGKSPQELAGAQKGNDLQWVFSSDGNWLAAFGGNTGSIQLWQFTREGALARSTVLSRHSAPVSSLAFSPGGRWLASGDRKGASILWNLRNLQAQPQPLPNFKEASVSGLAFGPGDRSLASGGSNGQVRLESLGEQGTQKVDSPLPIPRNRQKEISALAFSPDGAWLAIAAQDRNILLWRHDGEGDVMLGNRGTVGMLAFSPNGRWLASGGATTRLWRFEGGEVGRAPVALPEEANSELALGFTPDGHRLLTGDSNGAVRYWELRIETLLDLACRTAGRNLIKEEWTHYLPKEEDLYQENEPCPELATPE